ncbi:MAG: transcription elongation factor GreA [Xanthobacteraceae bacterium]|nr:transcription elongation factor GreA [Xanthobacteraceae bacterium]MBV9240156.1 transcription elongation factor GreA [Xanthobacteraceae bacterium]MBV9632101.1 transcription elongation factor GreA [Xanthobacteraceae bacterium]
MSRAFVKNTDEATDELPDRPISPQPNIVTAEGLAAIEANVARFQDEYARAQTQNDRPALAAASRELRYWSSRMASAQLAPMPADTGQVQFGCQVTILRHDGRQQTYRIVGEDEADPTNGKISYLSPVARALMGCRVGDVVTAGNMEVELVAIDV